jgi:hypothetical protein
MTAIIFYLIKKRFFEYLYSFFGQFGSVCNLFLQIALFTIGDKNWQGRCQLATKIKEQKYKKSFVLFTF